MVRRKHYDVARDFFGARTVWQRFAIFGVAIFGFVASTASLVVAVSVQDMVTTGLLVVAAIGAAFLAVEVGSGVSSRV